LYYNILHGVQVNHNHKIKYSDFADGVGHSFGSERGVTDLKGVVWLITSNLWAMINNCLRKLRLWASSVSRILNEL